MPGDAIPFDGIVDLADLNAVRNNFGAAASQAVPEPGSMVICVLTFGIAALGLRRVRCG